MPEPKSTLRVGERSQTSMLLLYVLFFGGAQEYAKLDPGRGHLSCLPAVQGRGMKLGEVRKALGGRHRLPCSKNTRVPL